jgi:hypothetical protein
VAWLEPLKWMTSVPLLGGGDPGCTGGETPESGRTSLTDSCGVSAQDGIARAALNDNARQIFRM